VVSKIHSPADFDKIDVNVPMVVMTEDDYLELKGAQDFLLALEAAGVDNWDGYEFAKEMM
jgi:hypothetical protein